ncbi:MAG: ATP-binding protein [Lachnospiraceae bacterium]|nr:ATP-binding protein [Lachnospiraceae bacterium]
MAIKDYQYNRILRHYDELQDRSAHIAESRRKEVLNAIPEYAALEKQTVDLSMSCAESLMSENPEADSALDLLKKQLSGLAEKKKALLIGHGFPADYLEQVYSCPYCKDTGHIGTEKCICFKKALTELIYDNSNLKEKLKKENFSTFKLNVYRKDFIDPKSGISSYEQMEDNLNICLNFVKDFDTKKEHDNLLLYGSPGLGKTFLSNCIAAELLKTGHTVLYLTAHQMFEALRNFNGETGENVTETADYIMTCDLLIIDDLGAELATSFTISRFNEVISERLLKNRSTILSTNLSLSDIGNVYGERNFSRISGYYTIMHFFGDDLRLKMPFS